MRVLIVDDSVVFRNMITAALADSKEVQVIGVAPNGSIALQKLEQVSIDVVTLDLEMPGLDGLEVLKEIRKRNFPVKVIIFSSQTQRGAEKALAALSAGADDVVAKPSDIGSEAPHEKIREILLPKVLQFFTSQKIVEPKEIKDNFLSDSVKKNLYECKPKAIVIASSTGGPAVIENIFKNIKPPLSIPIFIAQHMPPVFTQMLARRVAEMSGIDCKEAEDGEIVRANTIYIAPGDFHLKLIGTPSSVRIQLSSSPPRNSVRPAADYLFESAALIFGRDLVGIVLTGMGEDGLLGCKAIKSNQGSVAIQNRESCVVFGMPGAVYSANYFDYMDNVDGLTQLIGKLAS